MLRSKTFIIPLIELVVIIFLGVLIVYAGMNLYNQFEDKKQHITVDFDDIDGLERGAPVRYMGVFIGSVDYFKIENNKVKVYFIINNPNFRIPDGSTAMIQFTGLVGAKTLELGPPCYTSCYQKENFLVFSKHPRLVTEDPIRITSFIEFLSKSANSLQTGITVVQDFLTVNTIDVIKNKINDANQLSNEGIFSSIDAKKLLVSAEKSTWQALSNINKSLDNNLSMTDDIIKYMNAKNYDADTRSILRITKNTLYYAYRELQASDYKKYFKDFNYIGSAINRRLGSSDFSYDIGETFVVKVEKRFNYTYLKIEKLESVMSKFNEYMTKANIKVQNFDAKMFFTTLLCKTEKAKSVTSKIEKAI